MNAAPADAPPATTEQHPLIFAAMAGVMADMAPVGKDGLNSEQKYKFRSIEDVMSAAKAALSKHQVFYLPTVLTRLPEERRTSGGKPMNTVHLEVRYDFYTVDGSSVAAVVWGEGADTQDKSTSKAMSMAVKYLLIQALNVAAEDMQDPDRSAEEAGSYRSAGEAFDRAVPASEYRRQQANGNGHAQANGNGHAQANGNGRNGHQPQQPGRSAPSYPSQPLADDDPWKDRIADLATGEEANLLWEEIAGEVKAGTMAQVRAGILQQHIRYRMHTRGSENSQPAANSNGHQAADPTATSGHDPWAEQADTDPWSADAEQPATQAPRQAPAGDSDWVAAFKQNVDAAPDADALNKLRRSIGQAILDKHITAQESAGLSNLVQERVRALSASGAE